MWPQHCAVCSLQSTVVYSTDIVAVISLHYELEKYKKLITGLQLQNNPSSAETSHARL